MAASIPIAQPSLRQRAKTTIVPVPTPTMRRASDSAVGYLGTMKESGVTASQPSSNSSSQPLSNQVSLSLFGDAEAVEEVDEARQKSEVKLHPHSPAESRQRLEKASLEEDSLNLPLTAKILLDRERAEKQKLQLEVKEQVRLHDFEKIMMMSQFQEERDVMKDQKDQLVAKLRSAHIYERSLIKDIKSIVDERDTLRKEIDMYKQRERIAAATRDASPKHCSHPNQSSSHATARRGHVVPSKEHRLGLSSAQECYTRHMKAYAQSLRQQQQEQQQEQQQQQQQPEHLGHPGHPGQPEQQER